MDSRIGMSVLMVWLTACVAGCGLFDAAGEGGGVEGGPDAAAAPSLPADLEGFGVLASDIDPSCWMVDVVADGGYLYVAGREAGLLVFDISTPEAPRLVSSTPLGGDAWDLDVAHGHAFVALGEGVAWAVDVSDPAHPVVVKDTSFTDTGPGEWVDVRVMDHIAFAAAYQDGLRILMNTTSTPHFHTLPRSAEPAFQLIAGAYVDDGWLYVADASFGVHFAELVPNSDGLFHYRYGVRIEGAAWDVVARDGICFAATQSKGLCVLEFTGAGYYAHCHETSGQTRKIVLDGDRVFLALKVNHDFATHTDTPMLQIADVSTPKRPVMLGDLRLDGDGRSVAVAGDRAYVAAAHAGLHVVDVSDPAAPAPVGRVFGGDDAENLALRGDYAYVAAGWAGLHVVDVSDPATAEVVGGVPVLRPVHDVALEGDTAYFAAGDGNSWFLGTADVADPRHPQRGPICYPETISATDIVVRDGLVYAANDADNGSDDFAVIDLTSGAAPRPTDSLVCSVLASFELDGWSRDLALAGDYAFVAGKGLHVLDISDPAAPSLARTVLEGRSHRAIRVDGDRAYVVSEYGLAVLDISNPRKPAVLAEVPDGTSTPEPAGLAVGGGYLYLAAHDGLRILDLAAAMEPDGNSKPLLKVLLGRAARAVEVVGGRAYVAAGDAGLMILGRQ